MTFYISELLLEDNRIRSLDEAFVGLGKLDLLFLGGNRLTELSSSTFYGATSLQTVKLADNQISTMEEGIFEVNAMKKQNRLWLNVDDG